MEIDRSAIRANYRAVKQLLRPECRIMSVVKADAYGLGLVPVARLLASKGVPSSPLRPWRRGLSSASRDWKERSWSWVPSLRGR